MHHPARWHPPGEGNNAPHRLSGTPPEEGNSPIPYSKLSRDSKKYFDLPFNPALKERAKALRKAGNLAEVLFWQQVHRKKFKGYDFDRQKIVGNYIVDFYCANCGVVVEIDGKSHDHKQEYDAKRDEFLQSLGLTVIHITAKGVCSICGRRWLAGGTSGVQQDHPAYRAPLRGGNYARGTPLGRGITRADPPEVGI